MWREYSVCTCVFQALHITIRNKYGSILSLCEEFGVTVFDNVRFCFHIYWKVLSQVCDCWMSDENVLLNDFIDQSAYSGKTERRKK